MEHNLHLTLKMRVYSTSLCPCLVEENSLSRCCIQNLLWIYKHLRQIYKQLVCTRSTAVSAFGYLQPLLFSGLNDFLDTKKKAFPRFFFLSNDEVLEILSEAKDPKKIQPFIKKCFEAVKELKFEDTGEITGMISVEGEQIPLSESIDPAATGTYAKLVADASESKKFNSCLECIGLSNSR